jgi:hypothetical protein
VDGIVLRVTTGALDAGNVTMDMLVGSSKNDKGLIDLLLLKHEISKYIVERWMTKHPFPDDIRELMTKLYTTHAAYTTLLGAQADVSFMGSMGVSSQTLVRFVESITVKYSEWDAHLKTWMRAAKSIDEMLAMPVFLYPYVCVACLCTEFKVTHQVLFAAPPPTAFPGGC